MTINVVSSKFRAAIIIIFIVFVRSKLFWRGRPLNLSLGCRCKMVVIVRREIIAFKTVCAHVIIFVIMIYLIKIESYHILKGVL